MTAMHPDDYRESAELFVSMAPDLARDVRSLATAGNLADLRILAHRLVGTIGFFDEESSRHARRLDLAIREGRVGEVPELVDSLEHEIGAVADRVLASIPSGRAPLPVGPPSAPRPAWR